MRIAFVSNMMNHHQKYLSDNLYQCVGGDFRFIATIPMLLEQKNLGYKIFSDDPYLIKAYNSEREREEAVAYIQSADVIISGSVLTSVISPNLFSGKLNFRYSERPLKKGMEPFKYIPRWVKWRILDKQGKKAYMLCASAFTAADYAKFGMYHDRALKWGYFPEAKEYDIDSRLQAKSKTRILWCGRMLDWKHPEEAVFAARMLKQAGYSFELNLIGTGKQYHILAGMIAENGIEDCVHLLGAKPSDEVRAYMERAGIYLFTSDKKEGWGAVLNESMNSGCAVVASHAIGAVPYLIKSGENGYVYRSGDVEELYQRVKYLLDHPEEQERIGRNAYNTIITEWNASTAAKQFVSVAGQLLEYGEIKSLPESGPCSRAGILVDNWIDERK